ncbi:SsrA-binding protein SmpB [Membranihabitans maritimus]|uniref:SsrA-binding protein SmpB n=1 Tax=Membranihabitans maritimus TaxID=2904244 RepID=UPI001F254593|nr:SsrA-binding protein SmpB [Membranihabitans maritimus]
MKNKINIVNRKAKFEYQFLEEYIAGIQLHGAEVKSIRAGKANMADAFCYFRKGELWMKNMHIAEYKYNTVISLSPNRPRKLLLKRRELKKLEKKVKEKGLTIIPYRVFVNERGLVKVKVALAQGKKLHDKRQSIKARDTKRDVERINRIKL